MITFKDFLLESNKAGSKFEEKVAAQVLKWLEHAKLSSKFTAEKYSSGDGDAGRDEDYSDVIVKNTLSGMSFFIECKKDVRTNIITTMFDINEDFSVTPVKGKSRQPIEDLMYLDLASLISQDAEFLKFISFLKQPNDLLGNIEPAKLWFGKEDVDDKTLKSILKKYNSNVNDGKYEADCNAFDLDIVRDSTRNMLACGVLWKMSNENSTWDICRLKDIDFYYNLVVDHYLKQKRIPAKYMQAADNLFVFDRGDNPLGIECPEFPKDIVGTYDLKFTPRFGSGAMYVTPRSGISTELASDKSFLDNERWPKTIK